MENENENESRETRKTSRRITKNDRNPSTATKASTPLPITIPIESSKLPLSPTTSTNDHSPSTSIDLNLIRENIITKAKSIHDKFVAGEKIKLCDYKLMSSGLSSIVDLIDQNEDSQQQLLEKEQWDYLNEYFSNTYTHANYILPETLKQTWQLVSTFCQTTKNTAKTKAYLKKIIEAEEYKNGSDSESVRILSVFVFVLELYDQSWMFNENTKKSEFDFLSIIWAPLIRKILFIHNNIILLKGGETINPYTQFMKQIQYNDSKNVKGMKIDLRFVVTVGGKDKDVGCMEAANAVPSNIKLHEDEGKLLVEAKDVLDGLVNNIHDIQNIKDIGGIALQVAGLVGQIFAVHVHEPKLYVGVPEAKLEIPSNIISLASFSETFESLMTSVIKMEKLAIIVAKSHQFFEDRRLSLGRQFNRASEAKPVLDYHGYLAPSWYPPTGKNAGKAKLPPVAYDEVPTCSPPVSTQNIIEYDHSLVDDYGWVKLDNDLYYNIETKITQDTHPFTY